MSDDLELLQRWRDGDRSAGEALARAHYREIFERIRKEVRGNAQTAADIAQQVFEVAVSKRDDIVTDFRRYLHGVTRFKLWEHFEKKRPATSEDEVGLSQLLDPGHGAYSILGKADDAEKLVQALRSLSTEEQAYIMWYYADRLTHPEIAERVGLKTSQVTGRIHRARDKLRRKVESLGRGPDPDDTPPGGGFQTWMQSLRRRLDDT